MNRLHELRKPLLEMTPAELRAHVEAIRADRLIVKEKASSKRKKVVASATSRSKALKMFENMTPAERAELMRELDDEDADD